MLSAGALIWISLRPLIRLGTGQIMLNIALPCLMFSKIVPAFTTDNIAALGPLVLVAIIYQAMGIVIGWLVRQLFWVPHRFRYGILVAGGFYNAGDIPTAVVLSIAGNAPFNGTADQDLAVAYIAAFILVFFILLFPLGGHRMIAWDYEGPEVEDEEVKEAMRLKRKALLTDPLSLLRRRRRRSPSERSESEDPEKAAEPESEKDDAAPTGTRPRHGRHVSFIHDPETDDREDVTIVARSPPPTTAGVTSPAPTVTYGEADDSTPSKPALALSPSSSPRSASPPAAQSFRQRFWTHARAFIAQLLTPASLSILLAFVIALVTPLKALFIPVPHWTGTRIPNAPDGQPPLAFVIDTATFVGAASVPLGLTCLGSALARLKVPRGEGGWSALPLGAITGLAVGKMILMPVIGVLMCQGLTKVGVIDPEDKVLRFICIFFSCLPTATTQVFLTQVYSGTGDASVLSAFLIPQYAMMVVSMTAMTAYTINLLF